jgi:hypothetical protein
MPTSPNQKDGDTLNPAPEAHGHSGPRDMENPGYETTDVNVGGVATFLGGLIGFVLVFFGVCYFIGIGINDGLKADDGPVDKWHQLSSFAKPTGKDDGKRQDLATNPEIAQKTAAELVKGFPSPRLDIDDGNQATADLHAREDLLLEHYSSVDGQAGTVRIPIERAMELIVQKGLPVAAAPAASETAMEGDSKPVVQAPLTTGFARTGYELETITEREQKMSFAKAEKAEK